MANLSTLITGQTPIGGATEKTYIQAPDAPGNLWLASNSGVSVSLETTTNLLPEGTTKRTAIKIQRASGSDYVYTRFDLDKVDGSKKMKIQWAQAYTGLVGSYTLSVVGYTDAGYTSGAITLPVSVANIQAMTGVWSVTFDAPSAVTHPYIELRINAVSGTTPLYLSGVLVGPGTTSPGSIISEWQSYTPTGSWNNTTYTGKWKREGSEILLKIGLTLTGAPSGPLTITSAQMLNGLGLTYNPSDNALNANKMPWGSWTGVDTGVADYMGQVLPADATAANPVCYLLYANGASLAIASVSATAPITWGTGDEIGLNVRMPISEWAGSGTMLVSTGALVEYSSNSNTGSGNDTTSFAYGSNGSLVPTITASVGVLRADKTVQFQYPVQADDMLVVEIQNGGTGPWLAVGDTPNYDKFHSENANRIGVGIISSPTSTTVVVAFAHGGATGTGAYGAAGVSYPVSVGDRWRVRKCKQTAPVGIDTSGLTSSGGGSGYVISTQTANFAAENLNHYLVDTSAVPITATLPAGTNTFSIKFSDDAKTWSIRPLTIQPATGERIGNQSVNESFICDVSGGAVQLSWDGLRWVVDANTISSTVSITTGNIVSEKNYVVRPDAAATDWISSNVSLVTVSTETSAGNLPENVTKQTAIKFTRVSGTTGYVYTRFVLDSVDAFRKLKIQWNQKFAGATGDFTVALFSFTSADYVTGAASIPLQTATVNGLYTGSFQTNFDAPSSASPYLELRIIAVAGTLPLYLSGVLIGPGNSVQIPVVTGEQSYTPSITASVSNPSLSYTIRRGSYTRVGSAMEIRVQFNINIWTSPGSGALTVALPPGLTVDYTNITGNSFSSTVGSGVWYDSSAGVGFNLNAIVDSSSFIQFTLDNGSSLSPASFGSSDQLAFTARIPIAQWAGSGNVNLISDNVTAANTKFFVRKVTQTNNYVTGVDIVWDSPAFIDNANAYNGSTRWTAPTDMWIDFSTYFIIQKTLTASAEARVRKNGTITIASQTFVSGEVNPRVNISGKVFMSAGDYITVSLVHGDTALNIFGDATGGVYWSVTRISDYSAGSAVGFAQVTGSTSGLAPMQTPQTNVTVTSAQAGYSTVRAVAVAYSDINGVWRLKFNIAFLITNTSTAGFNIAITGASFPNVVQSCGLVVLGGSNSLMGAYTNFPITPSTISLYAPTAVTMNAGFISGDVELSSKPTWA